MSSKDPKELPFLVMVVWRAVNAICQIFIVADLLVLFRVKGGIVEQVAWAHTVFSRGGQLMKLGMTSSNIWTK